MVTLLAMQLVVRSSPCNSARYELAYALSGSRSFPAISSVPVKTVYAAADAPVMMSTDPSEPASGDSVEGRRNSTGPLLRDTVGRREYSSLVHTVSSRMPMVTGIDLDGRVRVGYWKSKRFDLVFE